MAISTTSRTHSAAIPVALAIALASPALAQPAHAGERYEGVAYARGTTRVLYRETHWQYEKGGIGQHLVLYRCPDGKAFARKLLRQSPSAMAPDFDFVDGRDGHREGVRTHDGKREAYVQQHAGAPVRAEAIDVPADGVIDAGFDAAVHERWQALLGGKAATIPFLLPSRHAFLPLQLAESKHARAANQPVLKLRMSLARWYSFALPSIELVYALDDRRLMEFQGIGSIRGHDGDYLDVRIVFPANRVVDQPVQAGITSARAAQLDGQCAG